MTRELHVAVVGLVAAEAGKVQPSLDIAVYRSDGDAIHDQLLPLIDIKSGGSYLPAADISTAILTAVRVFLADPSGWNVANSYDAVYLYGAVTT